VTDFVHFWKGGGGGEILVQNSEGDGGGSCFRTAQDGERGDMVETMLLQASPGERERDPVLSKTLIDKKKLSRDCIIDPPARTHV